MRGHSDRLVGKNVIPNIVNHIIRERAIHKNKHSHKQCDTEVRITVHMQIFTRYSGLKYIFVSINTYRYAALEIGVCSK